VARNALLKAAVQATRLASLVFVLGVARTLGPAEFGKFAFAYALATLLGVALDAGIPAVLTRDVARRPAGAAAGWAAAGILKLRLLVPAGTALLLAPLATGRAWDTTAAVWLLGLALTLQSFVENAVAVFTGVQRLEYEVLVRVVEKTALVGGGVAGLALGGGLLAVCGAFAGAAALALVLATSLVHGRVAPLGRTGSTGAARALGRGLAPVALALLLDFATSRLAPLAVAILAGDEAAGHFGAAFRVLDVVMVVPVTLVAAVYPVLARLASQPVRFGEVLRPAMDLLVLAALAVAVGLLAGAPWLTPGLLGGRYRPAAPLLALLGVGAALAMLQHLLGVVCLALDRGGRLLAVAAAGCGLSLLATPWLVQRAGALGGAVAVVLVEAAAVGASLTALVPLVGWPFGAGALKGLAAASGAGLAAASLPPGGPWRLAVALAAYGGGLAWLRAVPGPVWAELRRGVAGLPGAVALRGRR
jgi:O-antigen/teichoic acid export membrane protein